MTKPHKHAALIKAWADGAEIEYRWNDADTWSATSKPEWNRDVEYRIKPEPKPDIVTTCLATPVCAFYHQIENIPNLRLTFDGETGKLKAAEVIA